MKLRAYCELDDRLPCLSIEDEEGNELDSFPCATEPRVLFTSKDDKGLSWDAYYIRHLEEKNGFAINGKLVKDGEVFSLSKDVKKYFIKNNTGYYELD